MEKHGIKSFLKTAGGKVTTAVAGVVGAAQGFAISVYAAEGGGSVVDTSVTDTIKTSMGGLKDAALIALGSVAGIAIVLFAGPYVWRYGKKIFKVVSS